MFTALMTDLHCVKSFRIQIYSVLPRTWTHYGEYGEILTDLLRTGYTEPIPLKQRTNKQLVTIPMLQTKQIHCDLSYKKR